MHVCACALQTENFLWNLLTVLIYKGFSIACVQARVLDVEHLLDGEDDVFDLRHAVILKDFGVWHGDIDTRHPGYWSIQVVECRTWRKAN